MATVSIEFEVRTIGNGLSKMTLDADALRKVMKMNVDEAQRMENKFIKLAAVTTAIQGFSSSISAMKKPLMALTSESEGFTKAMRAANTMAGRDESGFAQLRSDVSGLSQEIPLARDLLANGLYQTISNGVPEDNWISFLEQSARSAVGGIADLEKVVGVTATVIKNYGLSWEEAGAIQDKIQLTAKNGVTSFEQMAQALPRVTGNAATLGVTIDELMATFATLTGVSGNTAEVSTQLAAIFTALVKPSSEAAKTAAAMGIQFDAAAIKAAGGFENFLQQLDECVREYAAASGVLEQEVYGKLFGSAEALRALVPLQGGLADKFTENVAVMEDSAGTIDEAFAQMNSGAAASLQNIRNSIAAWTDYAATLASSAMPIIEIGEQITTLSLNISYLGKSFKQLYNFATVNIHFTRIISLAERMGVSVKKLTGVFVAFGAQIRGTSLSISVMRLALRSLMMVTGVGAVIVGVSMAMEWLAGSSAKAAGEMGDAADALTDLEDGTDEYARAAADAKVRIDSQIASLRKLIDEHGNETRAVKELNQEYGHMFGNKSTAQEWYDTLVRNSQRYIKQMGYEAQARSLAMAQAQNELDRQIAAERKADWERANRDKMRRGARDKVTGTTHMVSTDDEWRRLDEAVRALDEAGAELEKRQERVQANMARLTESGQHTIRIQAKLRIDDMTLAQVEDEIKRVKEELKGTTDAGRIASLRAELTQLTTRQHTLEQQTGLGTGGRTPTAGHTKAATTGREKTEVTDPQTYEELTNNIEIYRRQLTGEDTEEQRMIVAKIQRWTTMREVIEQARKAAERPADLTTLEDYDREIAYQEHMRLRVSADRIGGYDLEIARLKKLRDGIEEAARPKIEPVSVESADTIEKIDESISILDTRIRTASADEIADIERTRLAYERKRKAMERGIELPQMVQEAEDINKLTGRDYKLRIRSMGFDELQGKIRDLQRMLADLDHPVTATQRADIEKLINTYRRWQRESIMSMDTVRRGWGAVEGIGSGIQGITQALDGQRNAWEMTAGVINGFFQVMDGVTQVVEIIKMLVGASAAQTAAAAAQTAANTTEAASAAGLAAAETFAAHASIPFVGTSMAAGMVALQQSVIAAAAVPKFADGGIVSGPTMALVGEYAGAASNPEVIAPLDRLRDMIDSSRADGGGTVHVTGRFRIAGNDLVACIANTTRIGAAAGRRSGIIV